MKMGILENCLRIGFFLKIKLKKNVNFGKLFGNRIFIKIKFLTLKYEELRRSNTEGGMHFKKTW